MAKILLVEDDVSLQMIYADRLRAEGFDVVAASDGEEGLALAVKETPDLIILDVMMPKISGFDVLDILRSTPETKETRIMMMTALSQQTDKERGERLGVDKYLVKSQVTLEDVVKNVNELIQLPGRFTKMQEEGTAPAVADDTAAKSDPSDDSSPDDTASTDNADSTADDSKQTGSDDTSAGVDSAQSKAAPINPNNAVPPLTNDDSADADPAPQVTQPTTNIEIKSEETPSVPAMPAGEDQDNAPHIDVEEQLANLQQETAAATNENVQSEPPVEPTAPTVASVPDMEQVSVDADGHLVHEDLAQLIPDKPAEDSSQQKDASSDELPAPAPPQPPSN